MAIMGFIFNKEARRAFNKKPENKSILYGNRLFKAFYIPAFIIR
jgi:hypothetical protein